MTAGGSTVDFDQQMMAVALGIARRGLGRTAPNPAVGAVIANEETREIIARGWTQPGGRPHAEPEALERAGPAARGATMYVTLEPCSHHGRTPPCADAIIAAGIKRVVVAVEDPDPRVSGRGLERLREAGIDVLRGVLSREAHHLTKGHIARVSERRPWVQLKMALSADGAIARGSEGRIAWVTGPQARAHGHLLRALSDAILVGRQTVIDDDPDLTCRLPGMHDQSPTRVVLAGRGLIPASCKLVQSAHGVPVWVFTSEPASTEDAARLTDAGVRIFHTTSVGDHLWLPAVAETLVGEGITRVLIEGGPTIWRAFAQSGLVDEIVEYRPAETDTQPGDKDMSNATGVVGLASAPGLQGDLHMLKQRFHLIETRMLGPDIMRRFGQ